MTPCVPTCLNPTTSQAHCPTCHRTFGGVGGFDAHRRGGICRDPAEFGYELTHGIWRRPMTEARLAQLRRP